MSQGGKSWPDRDSNPGPPAYRASTFQLSYRATWSSFDIKCHRGGKNRGPTRTRTQGLSLTSRLPFSPCLIRFVPESSRNNGGSTRHAHFHARCSSCDPTLSHKMSREEKNGPTGTRTQGLSLTARALCQLSYRATWSSFYICFVDTDIVLDYQQTTD